MPSAMPTHLAVIKLRDYQDAVFERTFDRRFATSKVKVQLFLVENVNDQLDDIQKTLSTMKQYGLRARIDIHPFVKPTKFLDHKPSSMEQIKRVGALIEKENPEGVKLCF